MSKIGIYKQGRTIYFRENDDDHSAISIEVTRIAKLLGRHRHEVVLLSPNDYTDGSFRNVTERISGPLDKILVFNGVGLAIDVMQQIESI